MSTEVTLAIPFYKGIEHLKKAIDSVLQQTSAHWKLIIVDDGGMNATEVKNLIDSYSSPKLSYSRNDKNLGMVGNWNRCLDLATTDLVTLFHADDELAPDYVETMLFTASQYPSATAFFCKARIIGENSEPLFSFPDYYKGFLEPFDGSSPITLTGEKAIVSLLKGNYIFCPTLCYRKSRIGSERFDPRWQQVQDLDFILRILEKEGQIVGIPKVAYLYRRHQNNATAQNNASLLRFDEERRFFDLKFEVLQARHFDSAARVAKSKRILKMNLAFCIVIDFLKLRIKAAYVKLKFLAQIRPFLF